MKTTLSVAIAIAIATPAFGQATFQTGNELLAKCRGQAGIDGGICLGYIEGANDMIAVLQANGGSRRVVCVPPSRVNAAQLVDIVVKWLSDNPDQRHHAGAAATLLALQRAFPCS